MTSLPVRTDAGNSAFRDRIVFDLLRRDGPLCWYCGEEFSLDGERQATIEHLIPLTVVRSYSRWADWNLALAHRRCNALAGNSRLANKFAFRDALRRLGGYNYLGHRECRRALGDESTRKQRRAVRATRRAELRWRFRASGAPGTAMRPIAMLSEVVRVSYRRPKTEIVAPTARAASSAKTPSLV